MSFVVFNIAHKGASIRSDGPSIRILGRFVNETYALSAARERPYETRVWPASSFGQLHDSLQIHWRPITNVHLSSMNDEYAFNTLEEEYKSIDDRKAAWTQFRQSVVREVLQAAEDHVLRPVNSIRGVSLLDTLPEDTTPKQESEKASTEIIVDRVSNEVPDQQYMILALHGDAKYETEKQTLLDSLGKAFLTEARSFLKLDDTTLDPDVEEAIAALDATQQEQFWTSFGPIIREAKSKLDSLVYEPMVAFFDVSYDYDVLKGKITTYAEHPDLKHIDLAVVKMYSWLRLDLGPKLAKGHKRAIGPNGPQHELANEFFQAMQNALK
jgi:hypothetical protein